MFRMTSVLCALSILHEINIPTHSHASIQIELLTLLPCTAVGHHQMTCAQFSQHYKGNMDRRGNMGLHTCNETGVLLFRFLEDVVELLSLLDGVSECSEICI